jgi:hypothetical protein
VIAAGMSFPFPQREVRLLGNSAKHELKPAVELFDHGQENSFA